MSNRRRRSLRWAARNLLRRWLIPTAVAQGRQIRFEPLETRQLMAADFFDGTHWITGEQDLNAANNSDSNLSANSAGMNAEGEAQNDLVAFAKALRDAGVTMFGAAWCPHCNAQKLLFEDGGKFLPFVEVTNPDRTPNSIGLAENITEYPTWEFQDGSRLAGEQSLATLSQRSGIAIPLSSTPTFDTIANQTVLTGSPLHVPVDAYDPNGNPLTITVTSSNPSLVTAEVLSGNKSLKMAVNGFGDMVFELFDQEVTRPTSRVMELANSGFYNQTVSNEIIFHRVINNFVIQAGDPTGTGSGGSTLGDIDDQFNVNLQHNRTGVLSYAKSSDDTNDSQFFITEGPQRHLDFNHSVFGQLVEGEPVREAISNTSVSNSKPTTDVVINSMTVFNDTENGLIRLKAVGSQTGTATITVTVTDSEGNSSSQSFVATVVADTVNSLPFLNDIGPVTTASGTPVSFQMSAQDVEGNAVFFDASNRTAVNYQLSVNNSTGLVTVTPPADFVGVMKVFVGARPEGSANTEDQFDRQEVSVTVTSVAPTGLDLLEASDTGSSSIDNITNAGSLSFLVSGTTNTATVEILNGTTVIGTGVASGSTITITTSNIATLGSGTYNLTARQTINNIQGSNSPSLQLVYDATAPVQIAASTFPSSIPAGQTLHLDLGHSEENLGLVYAIQNGPAGVAINSSTGVLDWTPTVAQIGVRSFDLLLTDSAGNLTTQTISISVADVAQVGMRLQVVDLNDSPITSIGIGQSFKLQIFVEDLTSAAAGVFSAYLDLLYNSSLLQLDGANPITRGPLYTSAATGTTSTLGLIDELGAFANTITPVGEGQKLLAEIRLKATAAGQANFSTNDAEANGSQVLLFGVSSEIAPERISFGTAALAIGNNFLVANDVFNFNEDSANNTLNVLANDTIVSGSGAILTIQNVTTPTAGGSATIAADGKSIIYTPAANYNGGDSFTYRVTDQTGALATATVSVQVQPVNDPPVAVNDTIEVNGNSTQNLITVLQNDTSGPDTNETLTINSVGTPSQGGTVTIGASGLHVLYSPRQGFVGNETFTYVLRDNFGATATATVTVTVKNPAPPPTGVNDAFTVVEDAATASFNLLANDTPAEVGQTLSITAVSAPNGTATVASNGLSINYAPKANFNGTELVVYTVRGSNGGTATATATFTVTAVNDAPNAVDDAISVASALPTTSLSVLTNDLNVDTGETLTIAAVTQPPTGQGTIAISSDQKSLIYTPASASFTGTVNFTYTLGDGTGLTDTANVVLTASNYTPRSISGTINDDGTSNDFLDFASFAVTLSGENYLAQPVTQSVVAADGTFIIPNLAPGNYEIKTDTLPFLFGGGETVQVQSGLNDGNTTGVQLNAGTLDARYIDIRDFLSNTIGRGLFVAAAPGQSQKWVASQGEWSNFHNVQVTLNNDASSVQIRAVNASNATVQTTLPLTNSQVSVRGNSGDHRLIRIAAAPSQLTLTPATTSTASGEGEQFNPSTQFGMGTPSNSLTGAFNLNPQGNSLIGEGEGDSIDGDEEMASVDAAMQQVSNQMTLISPAGDFIAERLSQDDSDEANSDAIDSAFGSLDDLMLT